MGIFGEEPPVYIAGFILTVISFIIHLIGFASPFWTYISKPDFTLYYELWQYCFSEDEQTTCESLSCDDGNDNPWCTTAWQATQVLEILGLLSLFIAVVLVSLFRDRRLLKLAGICCCFIGGVFILIGVIVYGTQEDIDQHSSFHFAFTICILSALGSVVAAILLIIGHRLERMNTDSSNDESDDEDQIGIGELDENRKSAAEEIKNNIKKEGLDSVLNNLNAHLDNWRNEPVKLALTGKSGVGKSSFINAIRNLKSSDRGFATASCSGNTTKQATVYKYPGNKNITLHDLPGIGTAEFPKSEYEEKMGLHQYDYFLLFVRNIEENDTELAKKLKKIKKPFCFVRSKLDLDIENAKNDGESGAEAIENIMSKSLFILEHTGLKEARFFVISNRNRRIGHFNELVSYIQSNLPEVKCDAVMFSLLGELTDGIIDSKYELLKKRIMNVSMTSAGVAAIPVPGVDVVLNLTLICREILLYHKAFGFGQQIIIEISKDKYLRKKLSASSIIEIKAANKAMQTFVIIQMGKLGTIMAVQSAFDFIFPIIGSLVSGLTAGTVTYRLLNRILKGCRDDAKLVYSHLMKVNAEKERKKERKVHRLGQQHSNYRCGIS